MDISNWINLGLLVITALVGVLSWLGTRQSAREARGAQEKASSAALRSAAAAEEASQLQTRIVEIENQRHAEAALESRRALLHAELTTQETYRFDKPDYDLYLTIRNTGSVTATNIEVLVNDLPLNNYQEFLTKWSPDVSVGPKGKMDVSFAPFMSGELYPPMNVKLRWDDQSGLRGEWIGTVN